MRRLTNRALRSSSERIDVAVAVGPRLRRVEVTTAAPGHHLVGEPLLGGREVTFEETSRGGFELGEEGLGGEHPASLPTSR